MTKMSTRSFRFPGNAVRICVDRCTNSDVEGRIYGKFLCEPMSFSNCGDMLLKTDYMFDERGFPQTFQQRRSFRDPTRTSYCLPDDNQVEDGMILRQSGIYSTFDVIVQSRKKSSWQGVLKKEDGSLAGEFHSEMELIHWIWDTVLTGETDRNG